MDVELPHFCVYWPPNGTTDKFGRVVFSPPQELPCRWEDSAETFLNDAGEQETAAAKVFFDGENRPEFLGVLKRGTLGDLQSLESPFKNKRAWEVRKVSDAAVLDDSYTLVVAWVGAQRGSNKV